MDGMCGRRGIPVVGWHLTGISVLEGEIHLMHQHDTVWGFYPGTHVTGTEFGNTGVFRDEGLVAVGWPLVDDLQTFVDERRPVEDFAERVRSAYQNKEDIVAMEPSHREAWFLRSAQMLRRFLCEAQPVHIVVYACKDDERVYTGRIKNTKEGRYFYSATLHNDCHHFRRVQWQDKPVPYLLCEKKELAQIRTQNTFWRMKNCPEKFLSTK